MHNKHRWRKKKGNVDTENTQVPDRETGHRAVSTRGPKSNQTGHMLQHALSYIGGDFGKLLTLKLKNIYI